jgi:hypothetical protein
VFPALGLYRVLAQQFPAAAERVKELVIEVVPEDVPILVEKGV